MKLNNSVKYCFLLGPFMLLLAFSGKWRKIQDGKVNNDNLYVISTKYGEMTLALYDKTPIHRDNFKKLVADSTYNGTLFHRVINGFMIQGGDPNLKNAGVKDRLGLENMSYTLPAEIHSDLIHKKGALAAARQGDQINPQKRSSGCQFYIVQGKAIDEKSLQGILERKNNMRKRALGNKYLMNPENSALKNHYVQIVQSGNQDSIKHYNQLIQSITEELYEGSKLSYTPQQIKTYQKLGGTPMLDMDYTVFGEIIKGLDIIDSIAAVKTRKGDRPIEDLQMTIKKL